ncbi:MAG: 1-aminocyclopropane-1-carboxylate deaminase/D-cysteine desulfhydrase [Flavobacteriaceae bacterium]|nr:1-aminocyclopropane-1-carboxylate deaminase/D-cysteine desulfhydrase [Flavobacteriaceae bacterium]
MNQKIEIEFKSGIELYIKRDDLNHPFISGNKLRKLKYNLMEAKNKGFSKIVTFGGAFSNHILATAAAGKEFGFETIGVIRGEELAFEIENNPTLYEAKKLGMVFYFVTREVYRNKASVDFLKHLEDKFGSFYLVPEGGTNELAIKGCEEILKEDDFSFDFICCAVGTGGTISGIINASQQNQKILGFPALKANFLYNHIRKFVHKNNWDLVLDYHFGGYGKIKPELITFLNKFYLETKVPLDPLYNGKMMFGIIDLISRDFFPPNAKILAIHTGGLQGIKGINKILKEKKKEIIIYED